MISTVLNHGASIAIEDVETGIPLRILSNSGPHNAEFVVGNILRPQESLNNELIDESDGLVYGVVHVVLILLNPDLDLALATLLLSLLHL